MAMTSDALSEAYDRLHRSGPEFAGDENGDNGLTNHGPMVAEVLDRQGYQGRILPWVAGYVPRLQDLPSASAPVTDGNWANALGDGRRVGDWTAYFAAQLRDRDWRDVLVEWWPRLLPGIAAGATHGVIRVAHSVRTLTRASDVTQPQVAELAHGLAFWAARSRAIPGAARPRGPLDPAQALSGIPRLADQSGLIAHRLARLADLPGWPAAQEALQAPANAEQVPAALRRLVHVATVRYLGHGHGSPVLLVHTATAPNAVLHTLPCLPSELWAPSLAAVWSASAAIVAAYEPAQGRPRAELPEPPNVDDPVSALLERATAHGDEHVIKFTDTALEVFNASGDAEALAAAAYVAQLIPRAQP